MADVTKGPEPTTKTDSLDGITVFGNKPVSIIPGANNILLPLKNHQPSITLAAQIVGIYLYAHKNDRDFLKILKLDPETPNIVQAKEDVFKAIHTWCGRVEHCRDL